MAEKMATRKELFVRIAEVMAYDEEVVTMCQKYIAQMEKPRKSKVNTEAIEFAEKVATAMNTLDSEDGTFAAKELAEHLGVSSQKVSAALRRLVTESRVERIEGGKTLRFSYLG